MIYTELVLVLCIFDRLLLFYFDIVSLYLVRIIALEQFQSVEMSK